MLTSAPTAPGIYALGQMSQATPVLTMLEGEEASRSWVLGQKSVVLGRDLVCDIALADAKASRKHTRIQWMNAGDPSSPPEVWLEDLTSTNGTWVNGRRVEEPIRLRERDKVLIGSTLFAYGLRIDEEIEAQRRLVQRATTDPLTAVHNREVFERALRREFERARRYSRPLSLLTLDLDEFARLNDTFGQRIGDLVLRQIGRILRDNLRLSDLSARIEGDQFGVILPETSVEGALTVGERLRRATQEFPMVLGAEPVRVTLSVGMVTLDGSFNHSDALFQAADHAVRRAKEVGKNRCVMHVAGS